MVEVTGTSWFCGRLNQQRFNTSELIRLLDGLDWPYDLAVAPHREILDSFPSREQASIFYRQRLASLVSDLLEELCGQDGYPPEGISHQALSELFYLCACLAAVGQLGKSLQKYYDTVRWKGPKALRSTERRALRIALERNQFDNGLNPVWIKIIKGQEEFLPGSWQDGLLAYARGLNAEISLTRRSKNPDGKDLLQESDYREFREIVLSLELRLKKEKQDADPAKALADALQRCEQICPSLRQEFGNLEIDAIYRCEKLDRWVESALATRLCPHEPFLDHIIVSIADAHNCTVEDIAKLRMSVEQEVSSFAKYICFMSEVRLRSIVSSVIPLGPKPHRHENGEQLSKAASVGF